MYLTQLPQPVEQGYSSGDSFAPRRLQEAISVANSNFQLLQAEIASLNLEVRKVNRINKQLVQLLNWIATTNPQILDEFQTTATAFDKLIPRDAGADAFAGPQAQNV